MDMKRGWKCLEWWSKLNDGLLAGAVAGTCVAASDSQHLCDYVCEESYVGDDRPRHFVGEG